MLKYKKTYRNSQFEFKFFSESKLLLETIERTLDFRRARNTRQRVLKVSFMIYNNQRSAELPKGVFLNTENAHIHFQEMEIHTWPMRPVIDPSAYDTDPIFLRPLSCLLHYHGYYHLHSSLVTKRKRFIVFAGTGGVGKSTLAVLLASRGFRLLCDDWFFIKEKKYGLHVVPLMTRIKMRNDAKKKQLISRPSSPEDLSHFNPSADIAFIFPSYHQSQHPRLVSISENHGVSRLIQENVVKEIGQTMTRASQINQLDFYCRLGKRARFFKLEYYDKNLLEVPPLIEKISAL